MKFSIVTFILLIINGVCLSQEAYNMPNVNGVSFPLFLDKSLRNNFDNKLDTLGIDGTCWLKFKISPTGNIRELEVSPGTNQILSSVLKKIILFSDSLWTFRNEKEWFILPFRYTLQNKGKSRTIALDPNELNNFFISTGSQVNYTFLPILEFVSSFDKGTGNKLKITKDKN